MRCPDNKHGNGQNIKSPDQRYSCTLGTRLSNGGILTGQ